MFSDDFIGPITDNDLSSDSITRDSMFSKFLNMDAFDYAAFGGPENSDGSIGWGAPKLEDISHITADLTRSSEQDVFFNAFKDNRHVTGIDSSRDAGAPVIPCRLTRRPTIGVAPLKVNPLQDELKTHDERTGDLNPVFSPPDMSEVLGAEFSLFGDDHYLDFTTLPEPLDNFPTLAHDAEAKPDWDIFVKDSFPLSERRIAPLPRRSTTPPSSILPSIGFMSSAPSPCLSTPPLSFAPVIDPLLRPSTPAFYRLSSPDVQSSDSEYDDSTASVRARKRKLARRAAPSSKRTKPNASSRHGGLQRLFFPGSPMTSDTSSSSSAASSPSPCGSSSPSSLNPDGSGKFRCPEAGCTQVCKTSGDLRRHLQSLTHRAPAFPCDRCGKSFTREDALKRHRVNVRGCATAKR